MKILRQFPPLANCAFPSPRLTRGHQITVSRKPTLSRREFETARRAIGSKSSLLADRRRGARRGGQR